MLTKQYSMQKMSHLDTLESEAIHILREVAAECINPALLFSGGKDSIILLRLAEKAFRPGRFPFPLLHIDTGHNFPEVIEFRDRRAKQLNEHLIVRSMEDSILKGRVVLRSEYQSRNAFQSITLLDAIAEFRFDACIGVRAGMKKKLGQKNAYFLFVTSLVNGIQKISVQNCGIFITHECIQGKILEYSQSVIGQNLMCGNISRVNNLRCHIFILLINVL